MIEGAAARLIERADLERASTAFQEIFERPPYRVYEIRPTEAFAFPTDGETSFPTRWRFP